MGENYYVLFILGTLAIIIIIAGLIRKSYILSNQMELANRARRRKLKAQASLEKKSKRKMAHSSRLDKPNPIIARELNNVPTPWGWPHHIDLHAQEEEGHVDVPQTLRRFVGKLINPKRTKQDQEYLEKRNASIRALLEDRYGRASRMTEMRYRKVKGPLLRDPDEPFDQLDDLPSSKADRVTSKLRNQPDPARDFNIPRNKSSDLTNVKTPWGW